MHNTEITDVRVTIFTEVTKMSYHHTSGALKRRERKRAIEAHTEIISKTVKLTAMFGKQRSVTVTEQMPLDDPSAQSAAVPEATSHSQDVRNVENGHDDNGPNQFVDALELDAVTDATADNKSNVYKMDKYPTDIALWPAALTGSMRKYWVKKGSELYQNKNSSFEASKVTDGDRQVIFWVWNSLPNLILS